MDVNVKCKIINFQTTGHTIKYCPQNRRGFFAQKALEKSKSVPNTSMSTPRSYNGVENTLVFTPTNTNTNSTATSPSEPGTYRRPFTAPAALPSQANFLAEPHGDSPRAQSLNSSLMELDRRNNYSGKVFTPSKNTDFDGPSTSNSNSSSRSNQACRLGRKGRGGRKKRAQNFFFNLRS